MKLLSRRGLLSRAWTPLLLASPLALAPYAAAETAQYLYDPLGRLVRVTLSDGTIIVYDYDAAGNRTRLVRADDSAFSAALQVTGTGPVNLRSLADLAGYTGATNATITFQVGSAVTIAGASGAPNGGYGLDTGLWPSSAYAISLALQVSGKVYGGGGRGGVPNPFPNGQAAGVGGDAVYCRENMSITVNVGGQIKAGGGGGGSGGGWWTDTHDAEGVPLTIFKYGGGGGGGFPNGAGGASEGPGAGGSGGTTAAGGAGGAGAALGGGRATGAGGAGGGAALGGASGAAPTGTEGCNLSGTTCHSKFPANGGAGAGYAIRKNGKTVSVTNNGTIAGTQG